MVHQSGASRVSRFSSTSQPGESPRQASLAEASSCVLSSLIGRFGVDFFVYGREGGKGGLGVFPEDGIDGRCLLTQHASVRLQQPVAAAALGVFFCRPLPTSCREACCTHRDPDELGGKKKSCSPARHHRSRDGPFSGLEGNRKMGCAD